MCHKATKILVLFAVIIAILAIALPPEHIKAIIIIENFFEVMIPILAVGALLKYLHCGGNNNKD